MLSRALDALGLSRPPLRAWALYDWANSAFVTVMVSAVFPVYFRSTLAGDLPAVEATGHFATATTVALAVGAVASPILGTLADRVPLKKRLLGLFVAVGIACTAGLSLLDRGEWKAALLLFGAGNAALMAGFAFYDSLLPHIAKPGELDRVSTAGYALGYVGGGLILGLNLLWIQKPEWFGLPGPQAGVRLGFVAVACWWGLFSVPLFLRVPEPTLPPGEERTGVVRATFRQLARAPALLRELRHATLMLVAFFLYNDGINTIIRMATIYGDEIGIDQGAMIAALLLTQFVGIPCSFAFGALASRIGAKRAVFLSIAVYVLVSALAFFMKTAVHFFALAILVGMVQGGSQALSRSLFASMIPRHKAAELFSFFGVFEKVSGVIGPAVFALTIWLTRSSRLAVLSVVVFFALGALLLARVDVDAGRRAARAYEEKDGVAPEDAPASAG